MAKRKRRRLDSADDVVGAAQGCRSGTRFGQRFGVGRGGFGGRSRRRGRLAIRLPLQFLGRLLPLLERLLLGVDRGLYLCRGLVDAREPLGALVGDHRLPVGLVLRLPFGLRSEEHTSELQSLMRISYAVFCLKKTNKTHTPHTQITL